MLSRRPPKQRDGSTTKRAPLNPEAGREGVAGRRKAVVIVLNGIIAALLLTTGYFAYAYISDNYFAETPPAAADSLNNRQVGVIQLDIVNRCGVRSAGTKFTEYLRAHGFDVVEIRNTRAAHIPRTLVVDRVGNLDAAHRVARALGVADEDVVQQLNPDYFVDVSVVVGDDYASLPHVH